MFPGYPSETELHAFPWIRLRPMKLYEVKRSVRIGAKTRLRLPWEVSKTMVLLSRLQTMGCPHTVNIPAESGVTLSEKPSRLYDLIQFCSC